MENDVRNDLNSRVITFLCWLILFHIRCATNQKKAEFVSLNRLFQLVWLNFFDGCKTILQHIQLVYFICFELKFLQ